MGQEEKRFGRYQVIEYLGSDGAMAMYRAADPNTGGMVVIRAIPQSVHLQPELVARLDEEASRLVTIRSEHVARVVEVGGKDGARFMVEEYVEGTTLDDEQGLLGLLPVVRVLGIALDVAEGLRAAIKAGCLHRDVKPANIILSEDRGAVLAGFGVQNAILIYQQSTWGEHPVVLGRPAYISPEVARGVESDHRGDIYSLGAVLYRCLTGRDQFDACGPGSSTHGIIGIALGRIPPPSQLAPGLPPAIDALLGRMMALRPEDRFQDYHELIEAVEETRLEC